MYHYSLELNRNVILYIFKFHFKFYKNDFDKEAKGKIEDNHEKIMSNNKIIIIRNYYYYLNHWKREEAQRKNSTQ